MYGTLELKGWIDGKTQKWVLDFEVLNAWWEVNEYKNLVV